VRLTITVAGVVEVEQMWGRQQSTGPAGTPSAEDLVRRLPFVLTNPDVMLSLLNAQVRLRKASVPLTVRLEGRARVAGKGQVILGKGVSLVGSIVPIELIAHEGARLVIGDKTFINYGSSISAHESVQIGRNCLLGHYSFIIDNDHHTVGDQYRTPPSKPVVIEDRVWLGARVIVLPGVRIGHDSVVGAGSVVTKDIPPFSVALGNPARVVENLDETKAG
jgi:maltose O-acetyltransferase